MEYRAYYSIDQLDQAHRVCSKILNLEMGATIQSCAHQTVDMCSKMHIDYQQIG